MRLGEGSNEKPEHRVFVVSGAGKSAARMHRVVVLFVLIMFAGVVAHGILMAVFGRANASL